MVPVQASLLGIATSISFRDTVKIWLTRANTFIRPIEHRLLTVYLARRSVPSVHQYHTHQLHLH